MRRVLLEGDPIAKLIEDGAHSGRLARHLLSFVLHDGRVKNQGVFFLLSRSCRKNRVMILLFENLKRTLVCSLGIFVQVDIN